MEIYGKYKVCICMAIYVYIESRPVDLKNISAVSQPCANICQCHIVQYHMDVVALITPS